MSTFDSAVEGFAPVVKVQTIEDTLKEQQWQREEMERKALRKIDAFKATFGTGEAEQFDKIVAELKFHGQTDYLAQVNAADVIKHLRANSAEQSQVAASDSPPIGHHLVGETAVTSLDGQPTTIDAVSVREHEREKYEKMWTHEQYRAVAPGEHIAHKFIEVARPKAGSEVIDFGAGTGRGALMLAILGMKVKMVDFADNCLDEDVRNALTSQSHMLSFNRHDLNNPLPIVSEYGYCFPAGTPVTGSGKTIDQLEVGDLVTNQNGAAQEVLKLYRKKFTGKMVNIKADCLTSVEMTDEHPVLVSSVRRIHRKATRAGQRGVFEWVASEATWKEAKEVQVGDYIRLPKTKVEGIPVLLMKSAERPIEVDEGLAWLFGLYVAEGHVGNSPVGRITLTLGATEADIAQRAVAEFKRLGIRNARISQPPSVKAGGALRVVADSAEFGRRLQEWCGTSSDTKHVPQFFHQAPAEIVRAFIEGLVDGDGSRRQYKHGTEISIFTVSRLLATDIISLLAGHGIHAALALNSEARVSQINGRIVNCRDAFVVKWSGRAWSKTLDKGGRKSYGRMKFIGDHAYARVTAVEQRQVTDLPVFNIHTVDETYGVPFTVHNCTDVLEHIPPEFVQTVVGNILKAARHVFFQISCVDDVCGKLIGEPLHLSIHPFKWWKELFEQFGCVIHWADDRGDTALFYVSAWITGKDMIDAGVLNTAEQKIRENMAFNIQQGWQQVTPHLVNDHVVMILGTGPSLNDQEDEIRRLHAEGVKIITLNGAYNWCRQRGLLPVNQVVVDAREFNERFTHPVEPGCNYFIASQCDPKVFEGLPKERTWMWHTTAESYRDVLDQHLDVWYGIPGGSTVLLRAIPMFAMLGFTKFHLFGCDSCCLEDGTHHAVLQPENNSPVTMPVLLGGKTFLCHPDQFSQAQEFIDLIRVMGQVIELEVHGPGLLAAILQYGAEQAETMFSATPKADESFAL